VAEVAAHPAAAVGEAVPVSTDDAVTAATTTAGPTIASVEVAQPSPQLAETTPTAAESASAVAAAMEPAPGLSPGEASGLSGPVVDVATGGTYTPALPALDDTFSAGAGVDLTDIADALATPEARVAIVSAIAAASAAHAAGLSLSDFAQPMLRQCAASVRATFASVRLVPCPDGAGGAPISTRNVPTTGPAVANAIGGEPGAVVAGVSGTRPMLGAVLPGGPWTAPAAKLAILRILAAVLATVSGVVAGKAGIETELRERRVRTYRRRLHS